MIGEIIKYRKDGTPWQIIAEGVLAKRDLREDWPEVVVLQMLDPPYPVIVMEKSDSRWKRMEPVGNAELVRMGADRRAEIRGNKQES
jgi:hypothetical protein